MQSVGTSGPLVRLEFAYDYMGRRTSKKVYTYNTGSLGTPEPGVGGWNLQSQTKFVYDGWNIVSEICNQQSVITTNRYCWGLDLSGSLSGAGGVGGLLWSSLQSEAGNSQFSYYVYNGNGDVMGLVYADNGSVSTSGTIVAEYEYSPFGETIKAIGPLAKANPFRFSSKYEDNETRWQNFGYRLYIPSLGRFASADPIGEAGGENLYRFVNNSPFDAVDPLGLALYAFDGTWQDGRKDELKSNVWKLQAIYLGKRSYQPGVGSSWYSRILGGAFGLGAKSRVDDAYDDFRKFYESGDQDVDIIGFSRGSAEARDFANILKKKGYKGCPVKIRFLGIFDTVGSMGFPGNGLDIGFDFSISDNVQTVAHAIAGDETRRLFPLIHIRTDSIGRNERRFKGAHADVGGGGYKDRKDLSNMALLWMWKQGKSVDVPFGSLPNIGEIMSTAELVSYWGDWALSDAHDSRYLTDKMLDFLRGSRRPRIEYQE